MLLGIQSDDERRDVDNLLADADVALLDEDTGVVDGLGEAELVDAGLQAALEEIFDFEGEHVIELHAGLVKDTDADETADEGVAFEETLGIFFVEGEELTGTDQYFVSHSCFVGCVLPSSTSDLGEGEHDTPDLAFVAQAKFADGLQLGVAIVVLEVP